MLWCVRTSCFRRHSARYLHVQLSCEATNTVYEPLPIAAYLSHVSFLPRGLRQWPQWLRLDGVPAPMSPHTPDALPIFIRPAFRRGWVLRRADCFQAACELRAFVRIRRKGGRRAAPLEARGHSNGSGCGNYGSSVRVTNKYATAARQSVLSGNRAGSLKPSMRCIQTFVRLQKPPCNAHCK